MYIYHIYVCVDPLWYKVNRAYVFIVIISIKLMVKIILNEDPEQVTALMICNQELSTYYT